MFKDKTLFVLGAGASCEFRLPSGEGLKTIIQQKLNILFPDGYRQRNGDETIMNAIRLHCEESNNADVNSYLQACWQVRDAMPQCLSIDNFLDAHQNNERINICGKLAIVQSIIAAEKTSSLMPKNANGRLLAENYIDTWLVPFAQRLTEGKRREDIETIFDNVTFIVFNYDRCLELALYFILQDYYFIDSFEAARIVSSARIHHPYGSLGRLPWQLQSSSDMTVEFGEILNATKLKSVSKKIRTFTEQVDDEFVMQEVKKAVGSAEKIIFLGFGFHDLNMKLLSEKNGQVYEIYGTVLGASPSDNDVSRSLLNSCLKRPNLPSAQLEALTSFNFLKQYGRAICL